MEGQTPNTPVVNEGGAAGSNPNVQHPSQGLQTGDPRANTPNPLQGAGASETPALGAPADTGQNPVEKLYAGKYKSPEELERAYQEAQRTMHLANQEKSLYQQQLQRQEQLLQQFMQQQSPQQQQLSPEEQKAQAEQLLERFYENPGQVMSEVVGQEVQKAIQPLVQQLQQQELYGNLERQVNHLRQTDPEFEQNYSDLLGFLQTDQGRAMAYGVPNGIEAAYQVIKSQKLASLTPETVLQDPNWRQKILENPEVKNAILQQYGQQVQAGQPPVVISGGQASNIPTSPVPDIKSTDDAKAASVPFFANILKRKGGTS